MKLRKLYCFAFYLFLILFFFPDCFVTRMQRLGAEVYNSHMLGPHGCFLKEPQNNKNRSGM